MSAVLANDPPPFVMLREAVEDALEALALCRIALLHDRPAMKMIDTHIYELKYALRAASGMSAGTAETASQAQGKARQPDPNGETPK